ncbi:MAG: prepilin-type N-terminal cleavage/methylation domain-containing protein [Fimbriimonadaceae bacterium]|nr:prepilin-type N-terminal cleavage/methylation domain-containing protein [Fimbriimonadaceae bacterium]
MRTRAGFSLIELLVVMVMVGILTVGLSRAFSAGVDFNLDIERGEQEETARLVFEDELRRLFQSAYLTPLQDDLASYFIAGTALQGIGGAGGGVAFTALTENLPGSLVEAQGTFEEVNQTYGPQGGVREISLSTSSFGGVNGDQGLFLRVQTPADGDPTQGGVERTLNANVESISFEFFDGSNWTTEWDSREAALRTLPFLVRITYSLANENGRQRTLLVRPPLSDVAELDNQAATGGATP